jgi:hypothetical protein
MTATSIALAPTRPDTPVHGVAEVSDAGEVAMGYANCRLCSCTAYAEPYDGTQICATCKHSYDDHW